jgi:hypothetical protein
MLSEKAIIGTVLRFAIIFLIFICPWPGLNEFYTKYFMALGTAFFSRDEGRQLVEFRSHELIHGFSKLDVQMIVCNRELLDSSGKGQVRESEFDARSIGYVPTALTFALVLATPLPLRRKISSLLYGAILINGLILLSLQVRIWDVSPDLSLLTLPPLLKTIVDDLDYTLLTQMGVSFSAPVLIWMIVTFRRQDFILDR